MKAPEILDTLAMAKRYKQRPSSILGIDDNYTAYCFDEACVVLYNALEEGKELQFKGAAKPKPKHYKSMTEFYKSLGVN